MDRHGGAATSLASIGRIICPYDQSEGHRAGRGGRPLGGTAGVAYNPCYHLACDTDANTNLEVLDVKGDAVAYATLTYALNTRSMNDARARGRARFTAPAGARYDGLIGAVCRFAGRPRQQLRGARVR
jgi:hypothetical protein